jgi:hypothetical protein
MKQNTSGIKPEWDTPPHGDFAAYAERLTASSAAAAARAAQRGVEAMSHAYTEPVAKPGGAASKAVAHSASASAKTQAQPPHSPTAGDASMGRYPAHAAPATAPPPSAVPSPAIAVLRKARSILLVLTALHALAWWGWRSGSLPGLMFMAWLWWGMGRWMQWLARDQSAAVPATETAHSASQAPADVGTWGERLRQMAAQRPNRK